LIRGVDRGGAPHGRARDLVRSPDEDLFREGAIEP
jgi:hypothetical protein